MSPPIYTPDGSEVSEIVLPDGSAASEVIGPDGNVVFEAGPDIPDSTVAQSDRIAHYDAQFTFDSNDDGTTITTWQDGLSDYNLSGGSPTIRSDGINGYVAVEGDSTDDILSNSDISETQPNTLFLVVDPITTNDGWFFDGGTDSEHTLKYIAGDEELEAGGDLRGGSAQSSPTIYTIVFDGSNSLLRRNGTDVLSGGAGSDGLTGLTLFANGGERLYKHTIIGEFIPCNKRLSSSEINDEEQRLSDKWGITV